MRAARNRLFAARRICVPSLLGLLFLSGLARGGTDWWSSVGPDRGKVFCLAVDPVSPNVLYAGGVGSVLKTLDGGARWAFAKSGMPSALVLALAIDPKANTTLYAGTRGFGVYKSQDAGGSWSAANAGMSGATVFALALDPSTSITLYAGTDAGVFKSVDGGASWNAASNGLGSIPVFSLAINPASPSTLYAGTKNSGVFRSTDGGASWTAASGGLTQTQVFALAIDPKTPSNLYAGTFQGIFKSADGAASWTATALQAGMILALAVDPVTPATVYAGDSGFGVFRSMDHGGAWLPVSTGLTDGAVNALAIDPSAPATLYAGTQSAIFKTTNRGGGWSVASDGLAAAKVFALAVDPSVASTIYAGTDIGVFKSVDGAGSWTHLLKGLGETPVFALAIPPGSPSTICAGFGGGVFRSTDGGASWTQVQLNHGIYAFALDPSSPLTLFEGGADGDVGQSTDGGATWTGFGVSATALPSVNAIAVDPRSPSTVYAGTDAGGYKTVFDSHTNKLRWFTNNALTSRRIFAVALDPSSSSTVFAGTDGGLFKSIDGGVSWAQVTNGLTAARILSVTVDRASSTFYAGTNGGVFKSTDGGASWAAMSQGLKNPVVISVAIAPDSPEALYAGTNGSSVFKLGSPGSCVAGSEALCLSGGRFRVRVAWRAAHKGTSGSGQAVPLTADTGYFWFFQSTNVELIIKVLDARAFNGKFWVFYGALSDVEYTITVTDVVTGEFKTYHNLQDTLASFADTSAFPVGDGASVLTSATEAAIAREPERFDGLPGVPPVRPEKAAACVAGPTALCLSGGRFRLEVAWRAVHKGTSGSGQAVPLTSDTGYFWFFQSTNVELVIKVLDARALNGKFWVFYGALSDVEYTITVTDTATGAVKTYFNPQDKLASFADISAF